MIDPAGLIARTTDDADRRVAWLEATADGRAVLERIHGQRRKDAERVLGDWSGKDVSELARLLARFQQSMIDAATDRVEAS